jgi:CDGSH-type Zn-finger protein
MNAAARVVESDVVAGRGDLTRGGRGREGGGADRREGVDSLSADGSHVTAAFRASGEPETTAPDPLPVRDGALLVTPLRNGPLRVEGNFEICAGTGRTVARVTQGRLCRCGHSKTKPFCDL